MKQSNIPGVLAAVCALVSPSLALEMPHARNPEVYLGGLAQGSNYTVVGSVRSDGFMHTYSVQTPYGNFRVVGDDLMKQRIQELRALDALEKMSQSDVFAKSFGQAVTAPIRFGADLIMKPGQTIAQSFSGVANMFDQVGTSMANPDSSRDTLAGSALGVDAARRQFAVALNVDPYTDFEPLAQKLTDIASAAALGGLSVRVALAAIPGGAGMAVSATSGAQSAQDTLRDKTSTQIVQEVRTTLRGLNVPANLISRFVDNRIYTPADLLIIARALSQLNARNTAVFIERAAEARTRDVAYFQRRRAELLASSTHSITEFVRVAGFPLNGITTGSIVAIFPLDELAWTSISERAFKAATEEIRRRPGTQGAPILATNGIISADAKEELGKLGWRIIPLK